MSSETETVDLREQLRLLYRNRTLILACVVVGIVVALAASFLIRRNYAAEAALTISRSKIGEGPTASEILSTANFRPLIESRAVASQVIKDTGLDRAPYWVSGSTFFGRVVEIEEVRNSSVLVVRGRLSDPVLVADVVNRVANLGAETARRVSQQEALQARDDIKLQLDEAKSRLDAASKKLDDARTASQLEIVERDVESALEQRGALLDLEINIETQKARLAKAEQELGKRQRLDTVVRSIDSDPALMESVRNSDGRTRDMLALQVKNEEINPVYQELDKQIASARTELAALERQKLQMRARKLDDPRFPGLTEMYAKQSALGRLEMERDLAKKVYEQVANSYESARLLVAGRSSGLQILTPAIPPDRPEPRKVPRNLLIGALTGFLLSSVAVLMRDSR